MLLEKINEPADLRRLSRDQLPAVADELRAHILEVVSRVGGHLASNLGAVELAVALHYALDTPHDRLIWDVGHQCYAHKALTGRRARLETLRRRGGLSGFPVREESDYDAFGTAHAGTAASAALGMAAAARLGGQRRRVAAVVGDGAMSSGMVFEALNNAGAMRDINLLLVLNDNEMSISPAVGALRNYLARILASRFYNQVRRGGRRALSRAPAVQQFARRAHEHLKGMVLPGTLFEEFGFNYVGPVDGHDAESLAQVIANLRDEPGPQFLHVVTVKGKGFEKAEKDPVLYHGVSAFEPARGIAPMKVEKGGKSGGGAPAYAEVFGRWLCAAAAREPRLIAITPAMREGSGMVEFSRRFADRYFDAGIAEQHALTFAAGAACEGMRPVVAIYSTFLQRAYDQLIHDIALQNLPVVFAVDRAGLVGADGATHQGAFDLSFLRCIPNLSVMTPGDEDEMWRMLNTALARGAPCAVRYPRGRGPGAAIVDEEAEVPWGRGEVLREGEKGGAAILSFGAARGAAVAAAEELNASVFNMRFVKPLDEELLARAASGRRLLAVMEENTMLGGGGGAVAEYLARQSGAPPLLQIGVPDRFIDHATPEEQREDCGLDAAAAAARIKEAMAKLPPA